MRRLLAVGGILVAVVIAALLIVHGSSPSSPVHALQSGKPGVSLSGPPSVHVGELFTLVVRADPAPDVPIGGLATEIVFPSGLSWVPHPNCAGPGPEGEIQLTVDGAAVGQCLRADGPEAQYVVVSRIQVPPLPPFDTPIGDVLHVDARCNSPGQHHIVLTAVPDSPWGSILFRTNTLQLAVRTEPFDITGDTVTEDVADVMEIECIAAPPTPCPPTGCPLPTAAPRAILDLSGSCDPRGIRPHAPAVVYCTWTVRNTGNAAAIGADLGLAPSSLSVLIFDLRIEGLVQTADWIESPWQLPRIDPGETIQIASRAVVMATGGQGPYTYTMFLRHYRGHEIDHVDVSFSSSSSATYPPENLVDITKTPLTPASQPPPQSAQYELAITNTSDQLIEEVVMETKHYSAALAAAEPEAVLVEPIAETVAWNLGSPGPGESWSARITVEATARCGLADGLVVISGTGAGEEVRVAFRPGQFFAVGDGSRNCSFGYFGEDIDLIPPTNDGHGGGGEISGGGTGGPTTSVARTISAPDTGDGARSEAGVLLAVIATGLALCALLAATLALALARRRRA